MLTWTSAPLDRGARHGRRHRIRLVAAATARRTRHGSPPLQDVAPDGEVTDVTAGWLRASLREVDEAASWPGAPVLPVPPSAGRADRRGRRVPNPVGAQRPPLRTPGHRIRLVLASDDQDPTAPAIMNFRHASVGTSSLNTVRSSSRLLLPVVSA